MKTGLNWRILVVDDLFVCRETMAKQLALLGYDHVTLASGAQEALAIMQRAPVDLVISDLVMPGMDGVDLLGQTRELLALRHTKFVLVSGFLGGARSEEAQRLGVDGFLEKPFRLDTLKGCVDDVMAHTSRRSMGHHPTPVSQAPTRPDASQ
jgi:CheY-like chemotaxis protein